MNKICSGCKTKKDISEFHKDKYKNDGLCSRCKECMKKYQQSEKGKEVYKKSNKKWYENNKEMHNKLCKRWCENNKEKHNELIKKWQRNNKKEIKEYHQKYYQEHKEEINKQQNKWSNQRKLEDPNFKLKSYLRTRQWIIFKRNSRPGSLVRDLGCTIEIARKYIESMFVFVSELNQTMSWQNWGDVWELDHIIPLASFDLTKREEFLKAAHYTNLRPLLIEDHKQKTIKDLQLIKEYKKKQFIQNNIL